MSNRVIFEGWKSKKKEPVDPVREALLDILVERAALQKQPEVAAASLSGTLLARRGQQIRAQGRPPAWSEEARARLKKSLDEDD